MRRPNLRARVDTLEARSTWRDDITLADIPNLTDKQLIDIVFPGQNRDRDSVSYADLEAAAEQIHAPLETA